MPTNSDMNKKEAQKMYDKDVTRFAKRIAVAYSSDKIRLVTSRNARRAVLLHDIDAINDIIKDIPNMPAGFQSDFCDAFIGEDMAGLDLATPAILGYAYRAISARAAGGEPGQQERLDKLATRIDNLSADFANSGGMVVSQNEWPLVDMSNIANVYEGFGNMLDARIVDVDVDKNPEKFAEIQANKKQAEKVVSDYDNAWGLDKVRAEDAPKLADRWDELYGALNRAELSEETKTKLAKCKFLDSKGAVIPQFTSGKRGDTKKYEEYEAGVRIAKEGRLASVVELARHNVAKRHVADFETEINESALEAELNTEILTVLYEIYAADKVVQDTTKMPEQFADPAFRNEFMAALEEMGEEISNNGYNVAIETQTDATVGWATRLRGKVGTMGKKLNTLWTRVNRPLERIDDMADVRMSRAAVERRKKRRDFFWGILKGFDSAFIVSGIITVSAAAAAAKMGVSLATGLAMIGGGLALGMIGFQVARWIKNQKKTNSPISLEEFFKDKQLVRSVITSALAIVAMGLGAAGLGTAAMTVGVGAALLGSYNNGRGVFESALDSKMSRRQAVAWAIANAGSVIGGALGGGYVGRGLVSMFNRLYPGNTFFQNKEPVAGEQRKVSDEVTHEKTTMHYTDKMLQSAKDAVEQWYAQDNPGHPEILQQDIDAVNQYNLDHDTNLDPYRILRAMKMSQPSRLAYTPAWGDTYNVPQETINLSANAVGGGTYNSAGIESAHFLESHFMGNNGNIGPVGNFTNKTYSPITELPTQTTETVIDQPAVYEQTYNDTYKSVDARPGYGAFGNYTPRERLTKLRDRVGSFLDRVRRNRQNESVSEDVPPVIRNDEPKDEIPPIVLDERDEELRIPEEKTSSPARREYVAPKISLNRIFPKPVFNDPEGHLRQIRDEYRQRGESEMRFPVPDETSVLPLGDTKFAMTYQQAKKWEDLHLNLARVRAKRNNSSLGASEAAKLRAQEENINKEIKHLYNQLGRPSMEELEHARADAYRSEKVRNLIAEYGRHMRNKPDEHNAPKWRGQKWEYERQKLLDKIADLGGADSLDDSNLRFAAPTLGRLEQKRAEVAQREKERQEQKHDVFVMPMREQPKQVKPTLGNTGAVKFMLESLMDVRGVPVKLLDLTGNGNPVMKSDEHAIVVVDVDGLRIPFFRANGDEERNLLNPGLLSPGNWYPVFSIANDGELFIGPTLDYLNIIHSEKEEVRLAAKIRYLNEIAKKLDAQIGNIAADEQIDGKKLIKIVDHQPKQPLNTDIPRLFWGGIGCLSLAPRDVKWFFNNVRSINYTEEQEKQELREERDENRRENRDFRRQKWQGFVSGIGNFADRARAQVHGRLFGWDKEDSKEYE